MKRIDRERWALLSPLLDKLLDQSEPERGSSLAQIRTHDGVLADELASLLMQQAQIERSAFLEGQVLQSPEETLKFVAAVAKSVDTVPVREIAAPVNMSSQDRDRSVPDAARR